MPTKAVPEFHNGLDASVRSDLARRLGAVLDDVYSLLIRTHVYHWNVEGPLFEPIHKLTEAQYTALFAAADEIAERMRALDGKPAVKMNGFPTGVSNLPESQTAEAMVGDLVQHHERTVRRMRELVSAAEEAMDVVTADLLTGLMAQHEKDVWMLRAMLKR